MPTISIFNPSSFISPTSNICCFTISALIAACFTRAYPVVTPDPGPAVFLARKWGAIHFRRPKDAWIDGAGVQTGHVVGCAAWWV